MREVDLMCKGFGDGVCAAKVTCWPSLRGMEIARVSVGEAFGWVREVDLDWRSPRKVEAKRENILGWRESDGARRFASRPRGSEAEA